jgi:hypothetical protein
VLVQSERFPDDPADAIPLNWAARGTHCDRKPDARADRSGTILIATVHSHSEESIAETLPVGVSGVEIRFTADAPFRGEPQPLKDRAVADQVRSGRHGMSFLRPLALRRARTLRPFFVAIRARNPCVRLRRTLLGW